jgi:hypothetical protein
VMKSNNTVKGINYCYDPVRSQHRFDVSRNSRSCLSLTPTADNFVSCNCLCATKHDDSKPL